MKILLLKDVPRVGNKGQVIVVSDAYGLNAFINKGLARLASDSDVKALIKKEEERKIKKEIELDKSIEIFKRLEKEVLVFKKKADEKNHFYAKVSKLEIVDMIFEKEKISISEKQIEMPEIVSPGDYEVKVTANGKNYKLYIKAEK